jgi:hypothetical protein
MATFILGMKSGARMVAETKHGSAIITSDDIGYISTSAPGLIDERDWRVEIVRTNEGGLKTANIRLAGTNDGIYKMGVAIDGLKVGGRVRVLNIAFIVPEKPNSPASAH